MIIPSPPGISIKVKREAQEAYRVYAVAALQALIAHEEFNSAPGHPGTEDIIAGVAHKYAIAMMKKETKSLLEIFREYDDSLGAVEEE